MGDTTAPRQSPHGGAPGSTPGGGEGGGLHTPGERILPLRLDAAALGTSDWYSFETTTIGCVQTDTHGESAPRLSPGRESTPTRGVHH